jgi:hypothetical protein
MYLVFDVSMKHSGFAFKDEDSTFIETLEKTNPTSRYHILEDLSIQALFLRPGW